MQKKAIDPSTGIALTPSFHGESCLGNGDHTGYACCCDECDFYLNCFPDWKDHISSGEAAKASPGRSWQKSLIFD